MGRRVELRSDWEEVKYQLMVDVCYAKFSQNKELKSILQATGEEELIENTTAWHDNVWGNCECERCKSSFSTLSEFSIMIAEGLYYEKKI